jgi:hypothetical protein
MRGIMTVRCAITIEGQDEDLSFAFVTVPRPGEKVSLLIDGEPAHFNVVSVIHTPVHAHISDTGPTVLLELMEHT